MNKNAADRISETDGFWDLEEMLPAKKTPRRFSSDTGTAEVSLGNDKEKEKSEPIPKRPVTGKTAAALDTARKALSDIESRLKTVSAAASHDRKTAYDEWKASRDTLSDGAENAGGVICGYTPERNPLIKKVTVKSWDAKYSFYGRFRSDALKYAGINGSPCGKVPFFSYTPQYSQLTDDQLACYFYWRDCVKNGEYPDTDYAYILLYI